MNLNELSLPELSRLNEALALIHQGASILTALPMSSDHDLIVHLRPGELVTITTHFQMPSAFVPAAAIEPVIVIEDEPDVAPAAAVANAGIPDDFEERTGYLAAGADAVLRRSDDLAARAEAAQSSAKAGIDFGTVAPVRAGAGKAAPKAAGVAPRKSAGGQKTGPLTDVEKSTIRRMQGEGFSSGHIAAMLDRRVQTVSLYLNMLERNSITAAQAKPVALADTTGGPQASADTGQAPAAAQGDTCAAIDPVTSVHGMAIGHPAHGSASSFFRPASPDSRPLRQREIGAHLARVKPRKGFDADLDLELVEAVARGDKLDLISVDLGVDVSALSHRWRDLTDALRDDKNRIAIDDQKYLVLELRRMVAEARSAA